MNAKNNKIKFKHKSTLFEVSSYNLFKRNEAEVIFNKALKLYEDNQIEKALTVFQESLKISQDIGYFYNVADCQYNIGMVYNLLKKYSSSLNYLKQALKAARKSKHYFIVLKSLREIGDIYVCISKYDLAEKAYNDSLEIANNNQSLSNEKPDLFNRLGRLFYELGQPIKAEKYYFQQLNIAKYTDNRKLESNALLTAYFIFMRYNNSN